MHSSLTVAVASAMVLVGSTVALGQAKFHAYGTIGPVNLAVAPDVSVALQKAKKKYTLVVEGMVTTNTLNTVSLDPSANGIAMDGGVVQMKCSGACTVTGKWYLDLSAADLANPGVFFSGSAGLPIVVNLEALAGAGTAVISVTAGLEKN